VVWIARAPNVRSVDIRDDSLCGHQAALRRGERASLEQFFDKAKSGSHLTLRWREMDSNFQFPVAKPRSVRRPAVMGGGGTVDRPPMQTSLADKHPHHIRTEVTSPE
jgi:hypothetical protein